MEGEAAMRLKRAADRLAVTWNDRAISRGAAEPDVPVSGSRLLAFVAAAHTREKFEEFRKVELSEHPFRFLSGVSRKVQHRHLRDENGASCPQYQ